jgi:hypothetical protein
MHYERLLVLACFAAAAVGSAGATLIVVLVRVRLRAAIERRTARTRARVLFALRTFPFVAGLLAIVAVGAAFLRYEPRDTTEQPGVLLILGAAAALGCCLGAARRLLHAGRHTALCSRVIARVGERIELAGFPAPVYRVHAGFPVAAVSGALRPKLILSSSVLEGCSADELQAILRHERAHVQRRDNLVRLVMLGLPDPLGLMRAGDDILRAWHDAAEEAADEEAGMGSEEARGSLAAALVRVAKMAGGPPPGWMPALALFDGDRLERRVRRLLDPEPATPSLPVERGSAIVILSVFCGCWMWALTGPRPLHEFVEWAVRNLP